jgi:hypothetical protein
MNGEIGVSHILRNDAPVVAVVSDRVYIDEAPQKKVFPYIILESRDSDPLDSKSGKAEVDIDIVGVLIYTTTSKQRKDLSSLVRTALDHKAAGTYNGLTTQSVIVYMGQTSFSEEETNRKIYASDQEYRLRTL